MFRIVCSAWDAWLHCVWDRAVDQWVIARTVTCLLLSVQVDRYTACDPRESLARSGGERPRVILDKRWERTLRWDVFDKKENWERSSLSIHCLCFRFFSSGRLFFVTRIVRTTYLLEFVTRRITLLNTFINNWNRKRGILASSRTCIRVKCQFRLINTNLDGHTI